MTLTFGLIVNMTYGAKQSTSKYSMTRTLVIEGVSLETVKKKKRMSQLLLLMLEKVHACTFFFPDDEHAFNIF